MFSSSHHSLRSVLADPALRESLLVSKLVVFLSAGTVLVAAWLWVLRQSLARVDIVNCTWLVVCGHALEAGKPSADYRVRLQRAAELVRQNSQLRLILAGGGQPSEAAVGRDWLHQHCGVEPDQVVLEEASMDTFENLRHAREMMPPNDIVAILTSRYHLGRVMLFARQLGIRAIPVPAETGWRVSLRNFAISIREAAFVCWFVTGRLWAQLARRERLLARLR